MPDLLNVFEHQRFRLRTPDGAPVSKSFRELVTEPDAAYALDYAQAFYDVAALNLLSYLAQVAFEPHTAAELAERLAAPMSEAEFEERVAPLRARFALTGDGPRFMQAPTAFDEKKAKPISVAAIITATKPGKTQADKRFLFRADADWAVAPEQAGLFLFARNTFYEGKIGGYKKGVNGDTPVRVLVTDPAEGDALWLRRTLWLNVLARDAQREYAGAFADPQALREGDYDGLFWADPPKTDTIPVGGITLRAGLGWMSAYHWLWYEEGEGICPLTGERVAGLVARRASKRSTGVAYGAEGDQEAGIKANRLFRHPNVPTETLFGKDREKTGERPFLVQRTEGLARAVGAAFFGGRTDRRNARYTLAPVVAQLIAAPIQDLGLSTRLRVFGFHMLGDRNVHGGIEENTFAFRPPAPDTPEGLEVLDKGAELMGRATDFAVRVAEVLRKAVRRTQAVDCELKTLEDGAFKLVDKKQEKARDKLKVEKNPGAVPFGHDVLAAFWNDAAARLATHAGRIADAAEGGADALTGDETSLQAAWEAETIDAAYRLYAPVYEHYSTLPRTMPYAHAARHLLARELRELRSTAPEGAISQPEPDQPEPA